MSLKDGIKNVYDRFWVNNIADKELQIKNNREFRAISDSYVLTPEQKNQIDQLYEGNFGEKVPYCWHQFFAAHSGIFTPEYFPDYLLHAHFEHYMNYNVHYVFPFEDKNILPYIAYAAGVRMPKTILSRSCGVLRNGNNEIVDIEQSVAILRAAGRVFCKPATDSCGGRGCGIEDFSVMPGQSEILATFDELGANFVIQELLSCHSSIKEMYPKAVNTFRIITYRWKDGFYHMPVFMRIGREGAVVDNGAAHGIFIGVHDDGSLTDYAVTRDEVNIPAHPDTGFVFKGHVITGIGKAIDSAMKMHGMIPQVGLVYWDFTIDESGEPVLIECNILNGTVYAIQMTHGVGPFGKRTPEVLSWMKLMKSLPASQRHNYAFGKM